MYVGWQQFYFVTLCGGGVCVCVYARTQTHSHICTYVTTHEAGCNISMSTDKHVNCLLLKCGYGFQTVICNISAAFRVTNHNVTTLR